ncbi:MAG TPA: cupin domain-containing protein [Pyrinomonadaceae bacterium]|jgi:anti-sigma factor ChrR (cupin superfamily)|nr:cupin domain-containing protein [Pyrinomonadaceae bacterium]
MTHATADEELEGQAALYALGALDAEEARAFESHLAEGCAACEAELREFEEVVSDLAFAAPEASPPAAARARLLALVSEEAAHDSSAEAKTETQSGDAQTKTKTQPGGAETKSESGGAGFLVVRAGEGEWRPTADAGVRFKLLFVDRERSTVTTLVRMEPGARIPAHRHLGVEQCLLLEGDLRAGGIEMSAGDFNCSLPGSIHEDLTTEGGALFLIVAPERYETLGPRAGAS